MMMADSEKTWGGLTGLGAWLLAALVLATVVWIYWPGSSGPLLLDDRSSLDDLARLQDNPQLAWDIVFGDVSGLFGRSVSMASFVAERLLLDQGMVGSKRVNIALHALNGALVMWLLALVFRHLRTPGYRYLAVVLGAAWVLHPLFVSTVLYAVQRMAILSTTFMLLAVVSYLYWRIALLKGRGSIARFILVPVFLLIGLFAKENAIVVVPVILMLEVLLFECRGEDGEVLPWLRQFCYGLIGAGGVGLVVALAWQLDSIAGSYRHRHFDLGERLLTQARILWDYVAQLFYPDVSRMGLYHDDFVLSTSMGQPQSTLYAVAGWALVLFAGAIALRWRWGRLLVLGVAWFVLAHSVESTVIALELYFEHRNYFPAVGLVLLVGVVYAAIVKRWPEVATPLLVLLALAPLVLSLHTSSQAQIWSNRALLALNHVNAHPQSARANIDLAEQLAYMGEAEQALEYSGRAFHASHVERAGDWVVRDLALSCITGHPVSVQQVERVGTVNPKRPLSDPSVLLALVRLLQDDRCPDFDGVYFADHMASIYQVEAYKERGSANIYSTLAVLENKLGRYDNALAYVDKFLSFRKSSRRGLLMKLHFATVLNKEDAVLETVTVLRKLEQQGKLTTAERQTLALYDKR